MTRLIEEEQQSAADQELENAHKNINGARCRKRNREVVGAASSHMCSTIYSKIHLLASILVVPGSQLGEVFRRFSALVVDQVFIHLDQYFEFLPPPPPEAESS